MCRSSSAVIARSPPVKCARVSDAVEHAAGDAADAESGHVLEPVGPAGEDRLGRKRTAAFAEIPRGEPRGVSGNEGVVAVYHVDATSQVVAVAGGVVVRARGETA